MNNTTITDAEGQYVIIITINNTNLTIANIQYMDCIFKTLFFRSFFHVLSDLSDSKIIIGGDFNKVIVKR